MTVFAIVTTDAERRAAQSRLAVGSAVRPGFDLPDEPWDLTPARIVCVGHFDGDGDPRTAAILLAAVRGCSLIVDVISRDEIDVLQLAEQLSRLGLIEHHLTARAPDLDEDSLALLDRLAHGQTIAGAARSLHMSMRTANRRLVAARTALGVATTREAVLERSRRAKSPVGGGERDPR